MLDWLIIGGGIHGTYLSNVLNENRLSGPRNRLKFRVLDPENSPLFWWNHTTRNCKMVYLRSPRVHHLGLSPSCLHQYLLAHSGNVKENYAQPYNRPSLKLFSQHSRYVIDHNNLTQFRLRARAKKIIELKNGLRVITTNGEIDARRIILCIGYSEQPFWPPWALKLRGEKGNIFHIFERGFKADQLGNTVGLVIVGGGITATQFALAQAKSMSEPLVLVMRHGQKISLFDSDPGWIGPKYLSKFHEVRNFDLRRQILDKARNRGSIPQETAILLTHEIEKGKVKLVIGEPSIVTESNEGVKIMFKEGVNPLFTKKILLATGFKTCRPGGEFIENAIQELNLPVTNCRYPIPDPTLRWHSRIFLSGPLAELEIGPVSRNIIGARIAAKRIAATF